MHYSRQDNPNSSYLSPALNLTRLYKLYETEVEDRVKMWLYKDIFVHGFNLSFVLPRADSGATYDKLAAQLSDPGLQDVQRSKLLMQKEMHTFYQRQLWVYNECVHVCSTDDSYMAMWLEGQGKRGSSEGASAIFKVLNELHKKKILPVNEWILWSDGCTGKNEGTHINEIYTSEDWIRLTESARHAKPFAVLPMKRLEVVDLASFTDGMFCRPQVSAGLKMRHVTERCIDKDKHFAVQRKYTYTDL
ncbi:hypothetical protein PR048_016000 [Dryococelus australis]|uniref:Uncharacterized protein n=1 Tax=Dryococelus australis TaxID=614101 RepID=A0ABQ9HII8_9NEOP|nr:hypothetical protein PR048_016000 [Dryococelus australis]